MDTDWVKQQYTATIRGVCHTWFLLLSPFLSDRLMLSSTAPMSSSRLFGSFSGSNNSLTLNLKKKKCTSLKLNKSGSGDVMLSENKQPNTVSIMCHGFIQERGNTQQSTGYYTVAALVQMRFVWFMWVVEADTSHSNQFSSRRSEVITKALTFCFWKVT